MESPGVINMKIPVKDVIVKNRIRKEMGSLDTLAESLKRYGQISPIVISKKNLLIAGGRRLEAAKLLGWENINAVIYEESGELEQLELEVEENLQRMDFTPEEVADAAQRIYRLKHPSFFRRILNAIKRFFKKLFRIKD